MAARRRDRLAAILGHRFARPELLTEALTHPSVDTSSPRRPGDYERLEFLGDRVLGVVIAEALLRRFPDADAGDLAGRYNALVRREALVEVAEDIGLGAYLHLAKGERESGGDEKPSLLADACEAVIAALYLDGGMEVAAGFIRRHWGDKIEALERAPKDAKTRLQEWAQGRGGAPPSYRVVAAEGPPHAPLFTVEVTLEGVAPLSAEGRSKRAAEQAAAAALLEALEGAGAGVDG